MVCIKGGKPFGTKMEYSCPGMFDGLCDIVDDSVGGVKDRNWLALRYKYQVESAELHAS